MFDHRTYCVSSIHSTLRNTSLGIIENSQRKLERNRALYSLTNELSPRNELHTRVFQRFIDRKIRNVAQVINETLISRSSLSVTLVYLLHRKTRRKI